MYNACMPKRGKVESKESKCGHGKAAFARVVAVMDVPLNYLRDYLGVRSMRLIIS